MIADATGAEIVCVGLYLGQGLINNECEAVALQKSLEHLVLL